MALHSDHINYLILRYLQEHGHEKAALAFYKDWQRPYHYRDPEDLPFANVVKRDALVSVVQDGLYFDKLSSGTRQKPRKYKWTVVNPRQPIEEPADDVDEDLDAEGEDVDVESGRSVGGSRPVSSAGRSSAVGRKGKNVGMRAADEFPTPAAKRQKRDGRVIEEVQVNGNRDDAMDVDAAPSAADGEEDAEVASLAEVEMAEVPERYDSMDVMTQTEVKVGPKTSTIHWTIDKPGATLFHSIWNPDSDTRNAKTLLAVGEGLCRFYEVPDIEAGSNQQVTHLDHLKMPPSGIVTASAWHPCGHTAACAMEAALQLSDTNGKSQKHLILNHSRERNSGDWDSDGLLDPPGVILALRYSPSGRYILALRTNAQRGLVQIWKAPSATGQGGDEMPLEPVAWQLFESQILDACWTSDDMFLVCGEGIACALQLLSDGMSTNEQAEEGGALSQSSVGNSKGLTVRSSSMTGSDESWDKLRYDVDSGVVAVVASSTKVLATLPLDACLDVDVKERTSIDGRHELPGQLTAAAFQPRPRHEDGAEKSGETGEKSAIFACTFEEGFCALYRLTRPEKSHTASTKICTLDLPVPALALAWSPSGRFLAVGGMEVVHIYDISSLDSPQPGREQAETKLSPLAIWPPEAGMLQRLKHAVGESNGNGSQPVGEEEEASLAASLSWSSDGESLGFALERQIAVIRFHPPLHSDDTVSADSNAHAVYSMANGSG
ncbi:hypothetical protein LTR62_006203 [Meristemomyces frigidus]|uniref:LisH domain-containing protein n=1 Tax=Meristemomyces frigidus TaxID=1508187 RepID=A0AAN7TNQ1_9PEZI|nr:hypothetical protein LTR62_006203 [Meristemomyces frigidus]